MRLRGIGIDLVSLTRMKRFLSDHDSRQALRILTPAEQKSLRGRGLSPLRFARLFAAKEAYSKALGCPLTGISGFRGIQVNLLPGARFQVKLSGRAGSGESMACGSFFGGGDFLGAQVLLWTKE